MTNRKIRRPLILTSALAAALAMASPAMAATAPAPPSVAPLSSCLAPSLSQPFLAFGDSNLYTLAPGGAFDNASNGWYFAGGASIQSTTQHGGSVGGVLDLPSKSQASSPPICITSDYPTARLWTRNVAGSEGVYLNVQYWNGSSWTNPKDTGGFHGSGSSWTLSNPLNLQPAGTSGWQQVRVTFFAGGTNSRFQVDDFWIDPRSSR